MQSDSAGKSTWRLSGWEKLGDVEDLRRDVDLILASDVVCHEHLFGSSTGNAAF